MGETRLTSPLGLLQVIDGFDINSPITNAMVADALRVVVEVWDAVCLTAGGGGLALGFYATLLFHVTALFDSFHPENVLALSPVYNLFQIEAALAKFRSLARSTPLVPFVPAEVRRAIMAIFTPLNYNFFISNYQAWGQANPVA